MSSLVDAEHQAVFANLLADELEDSSIEVA